MLLQKIKPFSIVIAWFFLLLSCQQLSFNKIADYSGLLPKEQLLYFSIQSIHQPKQRNSLYLEVQAQLLKNKQLENFMKRRLQRSQIAIGPRGQIYAINQLELDNQILNRQLDKQADWQTIPRLPDVYLRSDSYQALQMPQPNLLYLSQGLSAEEQVLEQQKFTQSLRKNIKRNQPPQRFLELQTKHPLVIYSPQIARLIVNPWLQKAFSNARDSGSFALKSFAKISQSIPVHELMAWVEIVEEKNYVFHIELMTGSLLLSKGLEFGFRLFLPSLLQRSKQEFIRNQLPNIQMESSKTSFHFQIPLNQESFSHILRQLAIQ